MAISIHQQILEILRRAKRPVIVLPASAGVDGYAGAFALAHVLKGMGMDADLVATDGPAPKTIDFLAGTPTPRGAFPSLQKFLIKLDVSRAPLEELSYAVENGQLTVFLTPRTGSWTPTDISLEPDAFRYDVIVALGAANLEAFGDVFLHNTAFWYATPIINIDHAPTNEHFGQVNLIDLTSTSVCEVLLALFEAWNSESIGEETATMLLTGMVAKTQSFKSPSVSPKTLQNASRLVSKGAKRDVIVDHLFRIRSVPTLRLWGRALARLKADRDVRLVWTLLSAQDFLQAGAGEEDLPDVIDELLSHAADADAVVILFEDQTHLVRGYVASTRGVDSVELALPFKPVGTRKLAQIRLPDRTLVKAEEDVIGKIRARLLKRIS